MREREEVVERGAAFIGSTGGQRSSPAYISAVCWQKLPAPLLSLCTRQKLTLSTSECEFEGGDFCTTETFYIHAPQPLRACGADLQG